MTPTVPRGVRVLAFTGMPGSGKSEAIAVVRDHNVPVVRMGDFVLAEVRARGHPEDEEHIGPVATGLRHTEGDDVWARRTLQAIRHGDIPGIDEHTPLVVIDGVRSPAEIAYFQEALGDDFILVAIESPDKSRHERILGRGRIDDAQDLELVIARDEREKGWGLEEAIRQADHHIHNDGTKQELHERIGALLDRLTRQDR